MFLTLILRPCSTQSPLLTFIGCLPICGSSALMGLLNSIIAGKGNPALTGVVFIWRKAKLTLLVCLQFFMVHFTNFIHVSTWPLLWWWFDSVTTWSVFNCLKKSLNCSETKCGYLSETNFFDKPNSANRMLCAHIRFVADRDSTFLWQETHCNKLHYTTNFCY